MKNILTDAVKRRTMRILNQSKTHAIFKSNLYLDIQVHVKSVTKVIFARAMQELIDAGEIEIDGNLIKRSDKKFLQVVIA